VRQAQANTSLLILLAIEVVTDKISDYLCESINGVTESVNVDFLGTIVSWQDVTVQDEFNC